jgi:hypothetical protein
MIDIYQMLAGAVTGFVVGLTGVGGGALMTPILVLGFGIAPVTAIATDLWFAALTKLVGARVHHSSGQVDWQVVRRLWSGSLPVALAVVLWVTFGPGAHKDPGLTRIIGAVVVVTSLGLLFAPRLKVLARNRRLGNPTQFKAVQPLLTILAGAVLGLCVALTSVGAGAMGSIMLLYLYPLRMNPHKLVATDLVHAIPLAVVAGLGYLFAGRVDGVLLLNLLLGSVPAIVAGSLLARKVPGRALQVGLALVLLAVALKMLA